MIRHALASDVDALLMLYQDLRSAGLPGMTWTEEYPSDEDIRSDIASHAMYVMEENGRIVGAVAREEDEVRELAVCNGAVPSCEISRVAVRRDLHGQGIGRHLLTGTLEMLKKEGYGIVRLLVSPGNIPACCLYRKCGFEIIGEADKYNVHWLCCEKEL